MKRSKSASSIFEKSSLIALIEGTMGADTQQCSNNSSIEMDEHGRARTPTVVLVAHNVSRIMGGEAVKALNIWEALTKRGIRVIQVTHDRVSQELRENHYPLSETIFIKDDVIQLWLLKKSMPNLQGFYTAFLLNCAARRAAKHYGAWLIHYTSPISTVIPYFKITGFPTIIGPLNGNIHHPVQLQHRDPNKRKWQRKFLPLIQPALGLLFSGKRNAARILVAGGDRTRRALRRGLVSPDRIIETLDSGVSDELFSRPRLTHSGRSNRLVFIGRLVPYKGCDLAIRAIAKLPDAELDIIGDGLERDRLIKICADLGVSHRVRFLGLIPSGKEVFDALSEYRAFLFPTLAEANGIVVQEAMMLGLPVITVDWGGPALLLDSKTGILIQPGSEEEMVEALAEAAARLIEDGALAERLSLEARSRAEEDGYAWSSLIDRWLGIYNEIMYEQGNAAFKTDAVSKHDADRTKAGHL